MEANLRFDSIDIKKHAFFQTNLINDYLKRFSNVYLNEPKQ